MNLDLNDIFDEMKGERPRDFFEFVRQRLPADTGFSVVPDAGENIVYGRAKMLTPEVERDLRARCRRNPGSVASESIASEICDSDGARKFFRLRLLYSCGVCLFAGVVTGGKR